MEPSQENLSPDTAPGLQGEIHMIRSIMQRVMSLIDEGHGLTEMLKLLDSLSMASSRLATLLKTDLQLNQQDDFGDILNEALAELLEEMNHGST